MTNT